MAGVLQWICGTEPDPGSGDFCVVLCRTPIRLFYLAFTSVVKSTKNSYLSKTKDFVLRYKFGKSKVWYQKSYSGNIRSTCKSKMIHIFTCVCCLYGILWVNPL